MKIIRIIARLNVGGPARHVAWLTAEMQRAGQDSTLVAGTVPPNEADMSYFARQLGVEPVIIPEMSREISIRDVVTVWKLYRLFRRTNPDIVHTHTAKAGTVGRIAGMLYRWLTPSVVVARPRRCRFVHTYHGHLFHSYYGRAKTNLFLFIERFLARFATDAIIVISPQQLREIHHEFKVGRAAQFRVVPLGIDLEVFADEAAHRDVLRGELKASEQDVLVGIVGRLTEVKDHRFFLRVAARYKEVYAKLSAYSDNEMRRASLPAAKPRLRFIIIGDGHLREELENEAARLGVAADVEFLGLRRDPEFFYPALDVVALTSLNEGTPLTLIEAMANKRAVIATAVGGVPDLIGDEGIASASKTDGYSVCAHGVLVTQRDAKAFAAGLHELIANRELREQMGRRGSEFVARGYSKQRLFDDITMLYQELLDGSMQGSTSPALRMKEATQLKGD